MKGCLIVLTLLCGLIFIASQTSWWIVPCILGFVIVIVIPIKLISFILR